MQANCFVYGSVQVKGFTKVPVTVRDHGSQVSATLPLVSTAVAGVSLTLAHSQLHIVGPNT